VDKGGTMTEIQQTMITEVINLLISESYGTAKEKGWYDKPPSFGEQIALMHSELSEALEEYRNNEPNLYKMCDKPEGIGVELADVCIRIFDSCGHHGIDLAECIRLKMEYNKTRSHKHGGKRI
jgi:NTP pyrophosphatase (non-canonical NTP hydrolase)